MSDNHEGARPGHPPTHGLVRLAENVSSMADVDELVVGQEGLVALFRAQEILK